MAEARKKRAPSLPLRLSRPELDIATMALWHWEGALRTWRIEAKQAGDIRRQADLERDIARTKNLKERMFRAKPRLAAEANAAVRTQFNTHLER